MTREERQRVRNSGGKVKKSHANNQLFVGHYKDEVEEYNRKS
jgi:hypothetical protein